MKKKGKKKQKGFFWFNLVNKLITSDWPLSVLDAILIISIIGGVILIGYAKNYITGAILIILGLIIIILSFIFRKKRRILFNLLR